MARRSMKMRLKSIILRSRINLLIFTLSAIATATFVIAALLQNTGSFTVMASHEDAIKYGLVLSDTSAFERPRAELRADPVDNMWNITQSDLPANIDEVDGSHNGENYMAYTFYAKNNGDTQISYDAAIDISEMHLAVDDAMRVKIFVNGVPNVYAKPQSNGSGEPEPDTIPFSSKTRIIRLDPRLLDVNQIDKYTIILWLEGEDPECVNSILGGSVKMAMKFTALTRQNNESSTPTAAPTPTPVST